MSLAAFAIRIATVRVIRAVVWPEYKVVDSPQRPLDLLEDGKPLIAVYTGATSDAIEGVGTLSGDPKVTLTIQIFLPAEVTVTSGGRPIDLDTREEGADTISDVIARRILAAFPTQAEPWSILWGQFVLRVERLRNGSYLVESGQNVRTAARELELDCEVLYDPAPGAEPEGAWAALIALMRRDDGPRSVAPLADWLAAEIAGPQLLPSEERDRIDLGLSAYAAAAASIQPLVRGSEIGEVAVTVDGPDGDEVVVPGPAAP